MLVDMGSITASGQVIIGDLGSDTSEYHNTQINTTTYAGVRLNSNGFQQYATAAGAWSNTTHGKWLVAGENTDFWVRATVIAGALDWAGSAATGSWLALSSTYFWGIEDDTAGVSAETASVQLELSTDSGGVVVVDDITYTLSAFNDNSA